MNRQAMDWKKVSVKHELNRGPMSRMYKELLLKTETEMSLEWTGD